MVIVRGAEYPKRATLEASFFKDQLTNYEKHQRGCLREVRVRIKLPGPSPALTHLPAVHPDPT